ncbi:glutamate receptor ionotropic, delta-2-like [Procambarus clarkii]|uniref:glutamate receptor ionotropic, delta-2-like n=1 Tax=Procambarus clarkii TaxID=6728 RepID=UPI001E6746AC|nr:ionotropic receptor 21a-like [Procambarus clarkii]
MQVVVGGIWGAVLLLSLSAGQGQCVRDEVSGIITTKNAAHDLIPVVDTSNTTRVVYDLFLSKFSRGNNHSLRGPSPDPLLGGRARLLQQAQTFLFKRSVRTPSQPGALDATIDATVEVVTRYLAHCVLEISAAADPAVETLLTRMRQALVPGLVLVPSAALINTTGEDNSAPGVVSACAVHVLLLLEPEIGRSRGSMRPDGVGDGVQEVLQVLRQTHLSGPRRYVLILAPYATNAADTKCLLLELPLPRGVQVFLLLPQSLHTGVRVEVGVYQRCQYCVGGGVGVVLTTRWVPGGTSRLQHLFDDHLRDFHGHVFHAVTMDFPPFIDYERTQVAPGGVTRPKDSMDIRILQEAATLLNFSFQLREPADGVWGYLLENGSWTGTVGTVERQEADFSMMLSITWERSYVVSFTRAYCIEPMTFVMRKPGSLPQWQAPIKPFHWLVWAVMVASVVLSGPGLWLLLRLSPSPLPLPLPRERSHEGEGGGGIPTFRRVNTSRLGLGALCLYMLAPFLSASAPLYPTSLSSRMWCGLWWFFCILTTTLYRGILISHLTVPALSPALDTLEQLASSLLQWGMLNTYDSGYQLFRSSEVPVYQALFRKMQYHDVKASMERVMEGNYAFISWKTYFRNLIARDYSDRNGASKVYIAREEFFPGGFGWAFPKHSPYLPAFDQVFQRLIESGLVDKWMEDLIQLSASENREKPKLLEPEVKGPQPFTVYHLQGIFFIMLGGYMLALLSFLGEALLGRLLVLS